MRHANPAHSKTLGMKGCNFDRLLAKRPVFFILIFVLRIMTYGHAAILSIHMTFCGKSNIIGSKDSLHMKEQGGKEMRYQRMTATGLSVSRLCLGTMNFGGQVGREDGIRMVHAALDSGINLICRSPAFWRPSGLSRRSSTWIFIAFAHLCDRLPCKEADGTSQYPNHNDLRRNQHHALHTAHNQQFFEWRAIQQ